MNAQLPKYERLDPRAEHDHPFTTEYDSGWTQIHHPGGAEAGFDLTDMGTAEDYRDLLDALDLPAEPVMVDKDPEDENRERVVYVWANDRVVIVTGNDPLTGTYSTPANREPEVGYCSYIGVEGYPEAVEAAVEGIRARASFIKEYTPGDREFI